MPVVVSHLDSGLICHLAGHQLPSYQLLNYLLLLPLQMLTPSILSLSVSFVTTFTSIAPSVQHSSLTPLLTGHSPEVY